MEYVINWSWLIALIFIPFVLGILVGIRVSRAKMTMKLLQRLDVEEVKKLMDN